VVNLFFAALEEVGFSNGVAEKVMKSHGFGPVARADAGVLILGSLPGKVSLERREYYAQPRNSFWRIMGELAGASPDLPYSDRLHLLRENRIALWDVCAAGCRAGSLDSSIQMPTVKTNDFIGFLRAHPHIGLICFNGTKAKEIFDLKVRRKPHAFLERIRYELLPSTSPAHAAMNYEKKLARWRMALGESRTPQALPTGALPITPENIGINPSLQGSPS
jgi:hypoxanthine-DNA glycosylase